MYSTSCGPMHFGNFDSTPQRFLSIFQSNAPPISFFVGIGHVIWVVLTVASCNVEIALVKFSESAELNVWLIPPIHLRENITPPEIKQNHATLGAVLFSQTIRVTWTGGVGGGAAQTRRTRTQIKNWFTVKSDSYGRNKKRCTTIYFKRPSPINEHISILSTPKTRHQM